MLESMQEAFVAATCLRSSQQCREQNYPQQGFKQASLVRVWPE